MNAESTQRFMLVAGPCAAETEAQLMATAGELVAMGVTYFRAGIWKPRTKPGSFEGVGEVGLNWLRQVRQEYRLKVATEVATAEHLNTVRKYDIDAYWIGARTATNPFALQQLANAMTDEDHTVFLKNPVNPDVELWCGAVDRLLSVGVKHLVLVHRGFSIYNSRLYRNTPFWNIAIEMKRRYPTIPLLCDPSHMGGQVSLIEPLSQQALDFGYEGLMVECHANPECALSDRQQQLSPAQLREMLSRLVVRQTKDIPDELDVLRRKIDTIDETLFELLSQRIDVCRQIGKYKQQNNLTLFQNNRYTEVLAHYAAMAEEQGLSPRFAEQLFEQIHTESLRQQHELLNHSPADD